MSYLKLANTAPFSSTMLVSACGKAFEPMVEGRFACSVLAVAPRVSVRIGDRSELLLSPTG